MFRTFKDRTEAGRLLGKKLNQYANNPNVLILALPRGGVPVAFEIAQQLKAKLDIFLVRKLGVPGHEELAMGAIAWGNITILNHEIVSGLFISKETINEVIAKESAELQRRNIEYRQDKPFPTIEDHIIILVDDGIATGATMRAAIAALKHLKPATLIVAIPVAPPDTCDDLRPSIDELICLDTPEPFYAVGAWYDDFSQTTDNEVRLLLKQAEQFSKTK